MVGNQEPVSNRRQLESAAGRALLTREQIAQVALQFLDREGLEALSMRRLASELGVGAMTLYSYYRSRDELLEAIVDAAVADIRPLRRDGTWQEQLTELMRYARQGIDRHPALTKLRAAQPVLRPEALRFAEAALAILRGAGLSKRDAAMSFRLLFTYVFGYATFSPQAGARQAKRDAMVAIRALAPEAYPQLTTVAKDTAEAMAGDEAFEFGLARIIEGLEALLPNRSEDASRPSRATRTHRDPDL